MLSFVIAGLLFITWWDGVSYSENWFTGGQWFFTGVLFVAVAIAVRVWLPVSTTAWAFSVWKQRRRPGLDWAMTTRTKKKETTSRSAAAGPFGG